MAGAALLTSLFSEPTAAAQGLSYGPIVGRGITADQTIVRWGTNLPSDPTALAYRAKGAPTWVLLANIPTSDHEILLTGLDTGATYEYEVRSLDNPVGAEFTTCPLPGRPMDFVFYGDSRTGFGAMVGVHSKVLMQIARQAPEMIFTSGDIVPNGLYAQYLSEFFPVAKDLINSTPYMTTPGNHDAFSNLPANYGLLFPTPRPSGTPWRSYYSFTCGNALFLSLDSNITGDATQLQFLTEQLQAGRRDATIDHVFVWLHHAPYSPGAHGDNPMVQNKWVPLFNRPENKVSAVFGGHDHVYARMDDTSGVFYIVSGGGGANLYSDTNTSKAKKIVSKSAYNFVSIHLAGKLMNAVAYDDTGTEIDRFDVTRVDVPSSGGSDGGMNDGGSGNGQASAASGCGVAGMRGGSESDARKLGMLLILSGALIALRRRGRRRTSPV